MEKAPRSELLTTINSQKDQLQQYKAKLRDVVAAYKSVVKEKEALEASVAVLSTSSISGQNNASTLPASEDGQSQQEDFSDPLRAAASTETDELSGLKIQVKTLSSSLTTLMQEKNKIEVNFIADKKQMKREIDDLNRQLEEEQEKLHTQTENVDAQITELKSRIRTHQLEREKDQTNHSLMLKELQELVSVERMTKEHLVAQLEDTKKQLKDSVELMTKKPSEFEAYERQIQNLEKELASAKDQVKAAEFKCNQPSPLVIELQDEIGRMKEFHQKQLAQEKSKHYENESRLLSQARHSEERISSLEAKLSELSNSVGNYERIKCQDQQSISKLRERITQLDIENTALVQTAKLVDTKSESVDESLEVEKIVEKIKHLREVLINVSEKSGKTFKLSSLFVEDYKKSEDNSSKLKQYKNELEKVRNEFDKYKSQTQSSIRTRNKDNTVCDNVDSLREQNLELKNKLRISGSHYQEELIQLQVKVDSLNKSLSSKEDKMNIEILQLKCSHQKEIGQLELELKKQRERTLAILSEKDEEIKRALEMRRCDDLSTSSSNYQHTAHFRRNGKEKQPEESEEMKAINRLLNFSMEHDNEAALLHFSQEKARAEVELSALRKQKREIEMAMRENHALAGQRESQLKEEIHKLKEKSAEIDRQSSREGANMEYLKNVLLKFFTSTDVLGKKQMMKALMTILQFSPQERKIVQDATSRGWWT